eukprot:TRINITY_DN7843_c0_g1_i1.p1 TRINITY_DN7843_c0_g1~~TRINITY_DN7843_c0_g1_i1.p1  ORF type:complete len:120 (-),score=40.09 TRINITY_DN7843_c0_g1_i1:252-611(-)
MDYASDYCDYECSECFAVLAKFIGFGGGIGFIIGGIALGFLYLVGFGSAGVVSGSFAAAWQSIIGNVAAGSIFANLTSVAMTGAISLITAGKSGATIAAFIGMLLVGGECGCCFEEFRN